MKRVSLAGFAILFVVPTVLAAPVGTFENPELLDAAGDVEYYDHYVGPRPIESIDFLRGWVEHVAHEDNLSFTFQFVDATDWSRSTPYSLECRMLGTLEIVGDPAGRLTLEWTRRENQATMTASAHHDKDTATRRTLPSSWNAEFSRPGNITVLVPRPTIAALATDITDLQVHCDHVQYVPTTNVGFGNSDGATSEESFGVEGLRPGAGATREPTEDASGTMSSAPSESSGRTPGQGALAVIAALIGSVIWFGRRK